MNTKRLHKVIFTNMRLQWPLLETNAQTMRLVKIWDKLEYLNIHQLCYQVELIEKAQESCKICNKFQET